MSKDNFQPRQTLEVKEKPFLLTTMVPSVVKTYQLDVAPKQVFFRHFLRYFFDKHKNTVFSDVYDVYQAIQKLEAPLQPFLSHYPSQQFDFLIHRLLVRFMPVDILLTRLRGSFDDVDTLCSDLAQTFEFFPLDELEKNTKLVDKDRAAKPFF